MKIYISLPLIFLMQMALVFSASAATAERRVALVIGNGDYQHAALKNPVHDAQDVSAVLRESGFDVMLKKNVTQEEMDDAIREFGKKLGKNGGIGLFYYAGHGVQVGDANYLIPVKAAIEAEKDLKYKAVNANAVLDEMQLAGNGLNIVILDACRNNPYSSRFRSATRGLVKMDGPRGSILAYSTSPGSVAEDGDGRNGIYTKHLLAAMKKQGMAIEQVFKQVRIGVSKETNGKQLPWESSSLTGDFFFNADGTNKPAHVASIEQVKYSAPVTQQQKPDRLEDRIAMLLAAAEVDMKEMRLTTPAGANAYDKYKRILSLDKDNLEAIEGQLKITKQYILLVNKAVDKQDIGQAKRYLSRARSLNPSHKIVQDASSRLTALMDALPDAAQQNSEHTQPVQVAIAKPIKEIMRQPFTARTFVDTLKSGQKGPTMVTIPTGSFRMGNDQQGIANEQPARWVRIDKPIAIGKYEITFEQYEAFARKTGRKVPSGNSKNKAKHPVVNVSWHDATAYANWLSKQTGHRYRLPSEAEWEYSARAGSNTDYWWGNSIGKSMANCKSCGSRWDGVSTSPVGSFRNNPFGLHDTVGNVWEWTQDCYNDSYKQAPANGTAWQAGRCDRRVLRGGAWNYNAQRVRSTTRSSTWPDSNYQHLGFRLVRDL